MLRNLGCRIGIHPMPFEGVELDEAIIRNPRIHYVCENCGDDVYTTYFDKRSDLLAEREILFGDRKSGYQTIKK